jgi:hypothetical protein
LFLEGEGGLEFKVQMQERALMELDHDPGALLWLSWDPGNANVLGEA